jgi:hypothetical protein
MHCNCLPFLDGFV